MPEWLSNQLGAIVVQVLVLLLIVGVGIIEGRGK